MAKGAKTQQGGDGTPSRGIDQMPNNPNNQAAQDVADAFRARQQRQDWRAIADLGNAYQRWLTGLAEANRGGRGGGGGRSNQDPRPRPRPRPRPTMNVAQQSAQAMIDRFLSSNGLEGLSAWAWSRFKELGGTTNTEEAFAVIKVEMVDRKEFKDRFPAYEYFAKLGQSVDVGTIIAYERQARDILNPIGADQTYTNRDIQKIMMGGVSPQELQQRVNVAAAAADSPALATTELQRLYNIPKNVVARFFLDPERTMVDIQKMWESGQIGAMSIDAGLGQLTTSEAERIAAGTTTDQAAQRFADMGQAKGIFDTQVGDATAVGRNDMIGFAAGESAAAQAVTRRAAARRAAYAGSSGFQASQGGVVGLGNAG